MPTTKYGRDFDFHSFMVEISKAAENYNVPVITLISSQKKEPFRILISTMLSARTKDEVTYAASERLFEVASTPEEIAALSLERIQELIYPSGFYREKAKNIKETSRIIAERYQGKVPDNLEDLLFLPGVGRKTANLVLAEAFRKEAICVDTHVHRISNRLGIVNTKEPYETERALQEILPKRYWITYNTFLVAHGQAICKPLSPKCSLCSVKRFCKKIGVKKSR